VTLKKSRLEKVSLLGVIMVFWVGLFMVSFGALVVVLPCDSPFMICFSPREANSFFLPLLLDASSCCFLGALMIVCGTVVWFSAPYMGEEILFSRFLYILFSFILSMVFLILCPLGIFFLLGWDGLGFTRFLLVCFYNSKRRWAARMKTFLVNRFGDAALVVSLSLCA
jgi:NADH:ubiquinone oxidoreductase subunit 5 (subunit L)/multisubunit Na+/H+ antiporter MnhA subunit